MEKTENLIMQEDRWKPLKEMNLTDDFFQNEPDSIRH